MLINIDIILLCSIEISLFISSCNCNLKFRATFINAPYRKRDLVLNKKLLFWNKQTSGTLTKVDYVRFDRRTEHFGKVTPSDCLEHFCQHLLRKFKVEKWPKIKRNTELELVHGELEIKCQSRNLELRTRVVPVNFIMEVKYNTRSPGMETKYLVSCK